MKHNIYCNNAGGSFIVDEVKNNIYQYMDLYNNIQLENTNDISRDAINVCKAARCFVNELLNNNKGDIQFGSSTTQLVRNVSMCLHNDLFEEVILCTALHYSMITPFEKKARNVYWWKHKKNTSVFDYNDLFKIITNKTTIVVLPHASNITGNIFDIKYIINRIKSINSNILVFVDGVAYMPHRLVDVDDLDVDFYFASFYKFMGPHISCAYIKDNTLLNKGLNHHFLKEGSELELGSFQNELLGGLLGIQDYITRSVSKFYSNVSLNGCDIRDIIKSFYNEIVFPNEIAILNECDKYLSDKYDLFQIVTDSTKLRIPIISLRTNNYYSVENVNLFLNEVGILSSCGKFHCNHFLEDNVLRLSFMHYTTKSDILTVFNELNEFKSYNGIQLGLISMIMGKDESYNMHHIRLTSDFKNKFDELTSDNNYSTTRYRLYSLLNVEDMNNIELIGSRFLQSSTYNKSKLGNVLREYEHVNVSKDPCFKNIVQYFVNRVYEKSSKKCRYVTAHQIRVEVQNNYVTPVPEGIHQDGYSFIAIICVNRFNIFGGESKIFSLNERELYSTTLYEGDILFVNDREVKHYVTNIMRTNEDTHGYRDIIVLTTVF